MKVIIVGGGFSGLVSAIFSKTETNEVIILEKNSICGKKILVTGNGKCNYSNQDQDISHYHTSSNIKLDTIINNKSIQDILSFYKSIGIIPKIKNGYYYPYSNQAITVQNALLRKCEELNIKIETSTYVKDITYNSNNFLITTNNTNYQANKVIIACGSKAHSLGEDENSYSLLERLGHTIIPVVPALTQIKVAENIKNISGVRSDVKISLMEDSKIIKTEIGEIQFTDYGISGICSMQLSRYISYGIKNSKEEKIFINFIPDIANTCEEFIDFIKNNKYAKYQVSSILDSLLNYKVTNYILNICNIDKSVIFNQLNEHKIDLLFSYLTSFPLTAIDTNSFQHAQICAGGVLLEEINPTTMESRKIPNLYIVGEILDVDGDCGGYNITFASITGMLAGKDIRK